MSKEKKPTTTEQFGNPGSGQGMAESEAMFRAMAEQTGDLISVTDEAGIITYASPASRSLFAVDPAEMCGNNFALYVHESCRERALKAFAEGQSRGQRAIGLVLLLKRKDGSVFYGELNGSPFVTPSFRGSLVVIRDVSERIKAEEALRESQQRNEALLNANPDMFFVFDAEGRVLDMKYDRKEDLYRSPETSLGLKVDALLPEELARLTLQKIAETRESGSLVQFDYRLRMHGEMRTYESRMVPVQNGTVMAVVRDISDRVQVEAALARSQEQLRLFVDANSDLMFLKDRDCRYQMVNEANARFFGLAPADILGKSDLDLMPREAALSCQVSDRQAMEERRTVRTEEKMGERVYEVTKTPVLIGDEVTGVAGIIRDVTSAVRAEEELLRSEEKFRAAFLTSPDSININRLEDGMYIEVNNGFLEIMGYEREEVMGKSSLELKIWENDADRLRLVTALKEYGYVENMEAKFRRKDGSRRIGLMSARVITLAGETCILSITRDITQRREVEAEKVRLETQLHQAQKLESVGRLAGGVAHDFNNMLGVIIGHAEMALDTVEPKHPLYTDLAEIRKAAERSADLTRQLLAFARKQTISPVVMDPLEVINGMISMLKRLIGEHIQLSWQPAPDLWPVRMDPSQLDQILANLCVNARDAVDKDGRIVIQADNCHLDDSRFAGRYGDFLRLRISDNGCGLDDETKNRLFEPFFSTKGVGKGTGLGLASVYGAVKQNGGFIDVDSVLGQGTTFTIYLPRHMDVARVASSETDGRKERPGQGRILLVEDEPAILNMLCSMLQRGGYSVICARSPGEALKLARGDSQDIDLLLTDVVMPEMNGRELARNLLVIHPRVRRLFMSGYTADVIAHHGVLEEGVHFIQKPFTMKELIRSVQKILEGDE